MSWNRKDWLGFGAVAALPVAGLFGVGPLAGLLGGSAGATVADALGVGLGAAPGESAAGLGLLGTTAGGAAPAGLLNSLTALQKAHSLMALAGGGPNGETRMPMPQRPQAATNDANLAELFAGIYPQRKRREDYV